MYEDLKFYLTQLKPERAIMFSDSWFTVGCVIYNCTNGTEEGYNIWLKFCKQSGDKNYDESKCNQKWFTFKKYVRFYSIRKLVPMIYKDGGTNYNPSPDHIVLDLIVRKFVYNILIPKLSIRRMRDRTALNNLCSAIYTMSNGLDKWDMEIIAKRIKDASLNSYFKNCWEIKHFRFTCGINNIIGWFNNDEKEKPFAKEVNVGGFFNNDSRWLEKTAAHLKHFDNIGCKPRFFKKISVTETKRLNDVAAKRKRQFELATLKEKFKNL